MEWYFGSDGDDLVVPKDQELLDRLPSPDSWLQWGVTAQENFGSPNKFGATEMNLTGEELNFSGKSFCDDAEMDICFHEGDHSSKSSVCGGLSEGSLHKTAFSCDRSDYQLNDLSGIDQMDDIFLSSLFEEDVPSTENLHGSFSFSPESQRGMMPADNLFTGMILDSHSISSDSYGMGSSKYLKTHAFSPSVGCRKGDITISCQKDCPTVKALVVRGLVPSEQNSEDEHVDDETSLEESVLQELEMVMAQLTEKTRICFRDALYRLAKNSKEHMVTQSQNGDLAFEEPPPSTVNTEMLRSGRKKATESETNTIDRAIANLMFSKMGFYARDLPDAASENFEQEAITTAGMCKYSLNQPQIPHCPYPTNLTGDAEVPIFGRENLPTTANLRKISQEVVL